MQTKNPMMITETKPSQSEGKTNRKTYVKTEATKVTTKQGIITFLKYSQTENVTSVFRMKTPTPKPMTSRAKQTTKADSGIHPNFNSK